jgi:hypothetical protein
MGVVRELQGPNPFISILEQWSGESAMLRSRFLSAFLARRGVLEMDEYQRALEIAVEEYKRRLGEARSFG